MPTRKSLKTSGSGGEIGERNSVNCFPVVCWNHLNRIPGTTVKKRAIGTFADALLAADAEVGINFDASKRWMIFVRYPEHARFDWAVLNTSRRARATGAAVGSNRQYSWPLLTRRFTVAFGHREMFVYNVVQSSFRLSASCYLEILGCNLT